MERSLRHVFDGKLVEGEDVLVGLLEQRGDLGELRLTAATASDSRSRDSGPTRR